MTYIPVASYQPQAADTAAIDLTATGVTNIISQTEKGILSSVGIRVNTVAATNVTATLEIQINGGSTQSISVYNGGVVFVTSLLALDGNGTGSTIGDFRVINLNIPYQTSCRVGINVTSGSIGAGEIQVTGIRSVKV